MKIIERICMAFFAFFTLGICVWLSQSFVSAMGWEALTKTDWPAWVQAVGSVGAIFVAIFIGEQQVKHANNARSAEREANRIQDIVKITHHLMAITGDLINRVTYAGIMLKEGGRPLTAFTENAMVIERRFETYFERDVYSCLSGPSIDLIGQMSGSICGLSVFSKILASRCSNSVNVPLPKCDDSESLNMMPVFEKLLEELNLLDVQIRHLRETFSYQFQIRPFA